MVGAALDLEWKSPCSLALYCVSAQFIHESKSRTRDLGVGSMIKNLYGSGE